MPYHGRVSLPFGTVAFLWRATQGHRLRPWRSPYVRWRVETYSGQKAETVDARDCLRLLMRERHQFLRFSAWLEQMRALRRESGSRPADPL